MTKEEVLLPKLGSDWQLPNMNADKSPQTWNGVSACVCTCFAASSSGRQGAGGVPSCPHIQVASATCSVLTQPHPLICTHLVPPTQPHHSASLTWQHQVSSAMPTWLHHPAMSTQLYPPGHTHPSTPTWPPRIDLDPCFIYFKLSFTQGLQLFCSQSAK